MSIVEKTLYKYEELNDRAKQRARECYLEGGLDYSWWEFCYDDFARVAEILGIDLSQRAVPLMNGKCRYEPEIYFSGFYHQGSGSSFCGTYGYAKGAVAKIKEYAPQDSELHCIAQGLQDVQRRHFYRLIADITSVSDYYIRVEVEDITSVSDYYIRVEVEDSENRYRDIGDAEDDVRGLMNDFNDWMFKCLQDEYEYLTSDEAVEESIIDNEYEFDEYGNWV